MPKKTKKTKKSAKKVVKKEVKKEKAVPKKAVVKAEVLRPEAPKVEKKRTIWTVGKRKGAIAQVIYMAGEKPSFIINNKPLEKYFPYFEYQSIALAPLKLTGQKDKADIVIKIQGGGSRAQAESIRLGISWALVELNPEFRPSLKKAGFLTRDARVKERKKPGLKRARRAPQWQKR